MPVRANQRPALYAPPMDKHRAQLAWDVKYGFSGPQKTIPSKYLYDARGSELFERICDLPEYYPTRTEISILDRFATDIMGFFAERQGDLIEIGSGSCLKIKILLSALQAERLRHMRYIPVDISRTFLKSATTELAQDYAELDVYGVQADFMRPLHQLGNGHRKMILFFGSTLGNLDENQSLAFMRNIHDIMNDEDRFLIGIDMLKPIEVLESAYNDQQGVTRAFNLNLLQRLNRELGADFRLNDFEHWAFFNPQGQCIEMHLRARRNLSIYFSDIDWQIHFRKGETIRTEICRKYSGLHAEQLFAAAGFSPERWFADEKQWFSLVSLKKAASPMGVAEFQG